MILSTTKTIILATKQITIGSITTRLAMFGAKIIVLAINIKTVINLQQVWSSVATYDSEYSGGIQVCEVFVCNTHFLNISWHCVYFCLLIISLPGSDF